MKVYRGWRRRFLAIRLIPLPRSRSYESAARSTFLATDHRTVVQKRNPFVLNICVLFVLGLTKIFDLFIYVQANRFPLKVTHRSFGLSDCLIEINQSKPKNTTKLKPLEV